MITLLKKQGYFETLWKNGGRKTQQIAIYPPEAELAKNNFLWRISSATVSQESPFSQFPGYERLLTVWKGAGLLLNQTELLPFKFLRFSGDSDIYCKLIGPDAVTDLGVIYNKDKIKARLSTETILPDSTVDLGPGLHFLFLAEGGTCQVNNFPMEVGDTLKIEQTELIHVFSSDHSKQHFFLITLKDL